MARRSKTGPKRKVAFRSMGDGSTDLQINIRTIADVKEVENLRKALEDQKKVCKDLGASYAEVDRKLAAVNATLDSQKVKALQLAEGWSRVIEKTHALGGSADGMVAERNALLQQAGLKPPGRLQEAFSAYRGAGGGLEGLKDAAGVLGKGPLIAATATVAAIEKGAEALKEYATAEERVVGLDAAMAQRGLLSDENRKRFQELAANQESLTARAKGEWLGVESTLVKFGADAENIGESVEGVKNLAGILDGDLQSAALHVGKALEGNFEAFSRLGIQFDDHMTQAQKLSRLWEELAARGGGQLEARADTLKGSFQRLKNGLSDSAEAAGHWIAEFLPIKATMYGLGTSLSWLAEKFGGTIGKSAELKNATKLVADSMAAADQASKTYAENMDKTKQSIDAATTALSNYLTKLNEQSGNTKNELDAKFARDTALVEKQLKEGRITPQQAAVAKAKLEDDHANTAALIDADTREKARAKISETIASENRRVQDKQKAADAAKAELDRLQKLQADRDKLDKRLERDEALAKAEMEGHQKTGDPLGFETRETYERKKREREIALANFDSDYGVTGGPGAYAREIGKAKSNADMLKKEFQETAKTVGDANTERLGQVQSIDAQQASAKRVQEYEAQTRRAKASGALQDAGAGDGAATIAGPAVSNDAFKRALPQSQAALQQLETRLESGMEYWQAMAASMSRIANMDGRQKEYFRQILARLKDMEEKHDILEAQIKNAPSR